MATTFINRHANVLHESLTILPDSSFSSAKITAHYSIYMDSPGVEIPMLFVAKNYNGRYGDGTIGPLKVEVDGASVPTISLDSANIDHIEDLPEGWQKLLDKKQLNQQGNSIVIDWSSNQRGYFRISDLFFFTTSLDTGRHEIVARYSAFSGVDKSDWVKRRFVNYSLSPAKYWKDFNHLKVVIDCQNQPNLLEVNLGEPHAGSLDSIAVWQFDALPADVLTVTYQPKVSSWAKLLISIGPGWIWLMLIVPFVLIHFKLICRFRKIKGRGPFNYWILIGGIIVPIIAAFFLGLAHSIIDGVIGQEASQYHGYIYPMIFLGPFVWVGYLGFSFIGNAWCGRRL